MKTCKITVLKTLLMDDLVQEHACKEFTKCPQHKEGDVFYGSYAKPEGFCDEAWKAIYQYVFTLANVSPGFQFSGWVETPDTAICSCNDGLRPVIFKVERTDEDWVVQYPNPKPQNQ